MRKIVSEKNELKVAVLRGKNVFIDKIYGIRNE